MTSPRRLTAAALLPALLLAATLAATRPTELHVTAQVAVVAV